MKKEKGILDNTFIRILLFMMMLGAGISAGAQDVTTVEPADAPADGADKLRKAIKTIILL